MPELPYAPDQRLTATRAPFGLSQREAAHLPGTTQGRLNCAEADCCRLPYPAALKRRTLYALAEATPAGPPPPAPEEADDRGLAHGLTQMLRAAPPRQRLERKLQRGRT